MWRVWVIVTVIYILQFKQHANDNDRFNKTTRPGKDIQVILILLAPISCLSVSWHVLFGKWASFKSSVY